MSHSFPLSRVLLPRECQSPHLPLPIRLLWSLNSPRPTRLQHSPWYKPGLIFTRYIASRYGSRRARPSFRISHLQNTSSGIWRQVVALDWQQQANVPDQPADGLNETNKLQSQLSSSGPSGRNSRRGTPRDSTAALLPPSSLSPSRQTGQQDTKVSIFAQQTPALLGRGGWPCHKNRHWYANRQCARSCDHQTYTNLADSALSISG